MKDCPACFHENPDDASICEECGYKFNTGFGSEETRIAPAEITGFSEGELISGRYRVVKELGRGGMGVVYLAADNEVHDDLVAVKMIHPNLLSSHEAQQRFADEVLISRKLTDTGIIRVHDLKRWGGLRFFTMEYIDGRSLREWITRRKEKKPPFTLPEVISVIDPLLKALSYAHQFTIHRDIKPENIMVIGEFPKVKIKILDFGIAKTLSPSGFTDMAHALGTAYYMAPEQMQGAKDIDHRADLYSVGMILYEMLTGTMALGSRSWPSELVADLPVEVDEIPKSLLRPNPKDRYADAEAVRSVLAGVVSGYETALEERRREEERLKSQREIADLLEKGQASFRARKWPEAAKIFTRILEIDPEHTKAGSLMKEVREKEERLRNLLKEAKAAEDAGFFESAIDFLNEARPLSSEEEPLIDKMASLEQALEEQKKAEKQSEIASLTKDAESFLEARRWSEAEEPLNRILELDPQNEAARSRLEATREKEGRLANLLEKLEAAEKSGDLESAIGLVNEAIPLSPDHELLKEKENHLQKEMSPPPPAPEPTFNKPIDVVRKLWVSVLLTICVNGLGHIYLGRAQRGFTAFFTGQIVFIFLALNAIIIFYPKYIFIAFIAMIFYKVLCVIDISVLAKKNKKLFPIKWYNRWYVYVIFLFFALSFFRSFGIQTFNIKGSGMNNGIFEGDYILVSKSIYGLKIPLLNKTIIPLSEPKRKDIVVFIYPVDKSEDWHSRVIGIAGDTIQITDDGMILNGNLEPEEYAIYTNRSSKLGEDITTFGPIIVPPNHLFVMGDNRYHSYDSRYWGFVPLSSVKGKVFMILTYRYRRLSLRFCDRS